MFLILLLRVKLSVVMLGHTDEDVDHCELFFLGVDLNRQQGQQTTILKQKSKKCTFRNE